jgi:hypothetical protein
MKFTLFSKISFEVSNPIALIESYCFQNDFYSSYDLLKNRRIEAVNKIGARIGSEQLKRCKTIINKSKNLTIFRYDLDRFLKLNEKTRNKHIKDLNDQVIQRLLILPNIGFSKTTKILHTIYPKILPMIDNLLQNKYRDEIDRDWNENNADQILMDYYNNLLVDANRKNLDKIETVISKTNLKGLTRIRIFDILWWSFLKADRLKREKNIKWTSINTVNRRLSSS